MVYYDLSKNKNALKSDVLGRFVLLCIRFSGAGGSRTLVQTRNQTAFYMLSIS